MGLPDFISFKDFLLTDPTEGSYPEDKEGLLAYQASKRKSGAHVDESKGVVSEAPLNAVQRRKRAISFRRNRAKIKLGRLRAKRRYASVDKLKARAQRAARSAIAKKLMGGKSKGSASYTQRASIERQLSRRTSQIDALARRLLPSVRKKDRNKMSASKPSSA
jgi:hypothetical protein